MKEPFKSYHSRKALEKMLYAERVQVIEVNKETLPRPRAHCKAVRTGALTDGGPAPLTALGFLLELLVEDYGAPEKGAARSVGWGWGAHPLTLTHRYTPERSPTQQDRKPGPAGLPRRGPPLPEILAPHTIMGTAPRYQATRPTQTEPPPTAAS